MGLPGAYLVFGIYQQRTCSTSVGEHAHPHPHPKHCHLPHSPALNHNLRTFPHRDPERNGFPTSPNRPDGVAHVVVVHAVTLQDRLEQRVPGRNHQDEKRLSLAPSRNSF